MKKISVIVNCFNGEKYLDKCLKSIINQKYSNFEIIFLIIFQQIIVEILLKILKIIELNYFQVKKNLIYMKQEMKL